VVNFYTNASSIRVEAGDGQSAVGTEFFFEIYVQIRWYWLAPLSALVLASGILWVGTIIQTQHTRTAIWKSSSLAALYALDGKVRKTDVLETEKKIDARSKQVMARLSREDGSR
jgi:hypothetical protein